MLVILNLAQIQIEKSSYYNFLLYHWNIHSIAAQDFSKIALLEAYNTHHKFGMIYVSETHLDFFYFLMVKSQIEMTTLAVIKEMESVFIIRNFWAFLQWKHKI